jgi:hypothetical protein
MLHSTRTTNSRKKEANKQTSKYTNLGSPDLSDRSINHKAAAMTIESSIGAEGHALSSLMKHGMATGKYDRLSD